MDPSYRLVPAKHAQPATVADTAGALGVHDALRHGPRQLATDAVSTPPLQARLDNWNETQDNLKLTMARNVYGVHAPIRLLMERKLVARNPHMPALPQSNVHLDILLGRDELLDTPDFMGAPAGPPPLDIHADMERKLRM